MGELLVLDLVLLVGIAVLPRHAGRSYLAVRRMVKEGLRRATARERVPATSVAGAMLARLGRALRPAVVPAAGALLATGLVAGYGAWSVTVPGEVAAEGAAPGATAGPHAPAAVPSAPGAPDPEAPKSEAARLTCGSEEARSDVERAIERAARLRSLLAEDMIRELRREVAVESARQAAVQAVGSLRIRIL